MRLELRAVQIAFATPPRSWFVATGLIPTTYYFGDEGQSEGCKDVEIHPTQDGDDLAQVSGTIVGPLFLGEKRPNYLFQLLECVDVEKNANIGESN